MFCYQCKQASGGCGCVVKGNCGKDANCAILQDLLIQMIFGIGVYTCRANELDVFDRDIDDFIQDALIATMTGVNHDSESIKSLILQSVRVRQWAKTLFEIACTQTRTEPYRLTGDWNIEPAAETEAMLEQSWQYSIPLRRLRSGEQVVNMQEMILYGVKGVAKLLRQQAENGHRDFHLAARLHAVLDFLANSPEDINQLRKIAMEVGKMYISVQESRHEENHPLSPRFEKLLENSLQSIEKNGCLDCFDANGNQTVIPLRLDGESELCDTLRFIQAYQARWLKDCEQKAISEWSADRIVPLGLNIDFYWDSQESISFYLAVRCLGIENIELHPTPGFMNCLCSSKEAELPDENELAEQPQTIT